MLFSLFLPLAAALAPPQPTRPTTALSATRKDALAAIGAAFLAPAAAVAYDLPDLPYDFGALEPSIDAATMKIHHDKHHATYIAGLNGALEGKPQPPIDELMPDAFTAVKGVRNSGGGVYNHNFFWKSLAPKGKGGAPSAELAAAIDKAFGSMDGLKEKFGA